MKRPVILLLVFCLLAFSACGNGGDDSASDMSADPLKGNAKGSGVVSSFEKEGALGADVDVPVIVSGKESTSASDDGSETTPTQTKEPTDSSSETTAPSSDTSDPSSEPSESVSLPDLEEGEYWVDETKAGQTTSSTPASEKDGSQSSDVTGTTEEITDPSEKTTDPGGSNSSGTPNDVKEPSEGTVSGSSSTDISETGESQNTSQPNEDPTKRTLYTGDLSGEPDTNI